MTAEISKEVFYHLVQLAALELEPDEAVYLHREMNKQLKSIQELLAIPLDSETPLASHGVPYTTASSPRARPDEWILHSAIPEILAQAPELDDGYIIVPEIPHTEL